MPFVPSAFLLKDPPKNFMAAEILIVLGTVPDIVILNLLSLWTLPWLLLTTFLPFLTSSNLSDNLFILFILQSLVQSTHTSQFFCVINIYRWELSDRFAVLSCYSLSPFSHSLLLLLLSFTGILCVAADLNLRAYCMLTPTYTPPVAILIFISSF